ncbi:MAG: type II toxin-antitoxin system PemK/MazF family toxin [Candidatus Levybacteria bacterium]|nr:type II toxin-antitoxin system PemK/MazF family toxin [Candidatus Levybacteria bacterium]
MYELVSTRFPFANDADKGKPRPGFVISPPLGKHQQVIVAYITTRLDEQLETDIVLDPATPYFISTGLVQKSLVKLHRISTFQPIALKEGQGSLPDELIPQLKRKLMKVFKLK